MDETGPKLGRIQSMVGAFRGGFLASLRLSLHTGFGMSATS